MRSARNTVPGRAALTHTAWPSSMPSMSVSLSILLLRCGSAASSSRPALQSCHVSPPSGLRRAPPTSSAAYSSSGRSGSAVRRITRQTNDFIFTRSTGATFGSRRHVSPPSSLR